MSSRQCGCCSYGWIPGNGQNLFSVIVELGCDQEMSVQSMALYCIVLHNYCSELYYTALQSEVYCTQLYCTALYSITGFAFLQMLAAAAIHCRRGLPRLNPAVSR